MRGHCLSSRSISHNRFDHVQAVRVFLCRPRSNEEVLCDFLAFGQRLVVDPDRTMNYVVGGERQQPNVCRLSLEQALVSIRNVEQSVLRVRYQNDWPLLVLQINERETAVIDRCQTIDPVLLPVCQLQLEESLLLQRVHFRHCVAEGMQMPAKVGEPIPVAADYPPEALALPIYRQNARGRIMAKPNGVVGARLSGPVDQMVDFVGVVLRQQSDEVERPLGPWLQACVDGNERIRLPACALH